MSDPEVPKETPAAAPAESPEKKSGDDSDKKKQGNTLLIPVAVAVVIIVAAVAAFFFLTPQLAQKGDRVSVYYTGTLDNGTVFDTNMNGTPLVFTIGNSSIIPGFEQAVIGMSANEVKTVTLPPEKAYGNYNPALVQTVNRTGPLENVTLETGQQYIIHYKAANSYSKVTVINVTPKTVTLDANNPLAGQNLTFTIKMDKITRPAQNGTSG